MRAFFHSHPFSFSYEYLRQILKGGKIPTTLVVTELCTALKIDSQALTKLASENRLAQKIRRHYSLPEKASLLRFSEKVSEYEEQGKLEAQLITLIGELGQEEKAKMMEYAQFLKKQLRKKLYGATR